LVAGIALHSTTQKAKIRFSQKKKNKKTNKKNKRREVLCKAIPATKYNEPDLNYYHWQFYQGNYVLKRVW
jgi:hypothetical protein